MPRESSAAKRRVHQKWSDLLFVHWEVSYDALRSLVPSELSIDLFDGRAYVTVIPFRVTENRPAGWPGALGTRFLETNVRTYVRAEDGEQGIFFLSLEASSVLAVVAARSLYGLPYYPAVISMEKQGRYVKYMCRRRIGRPAMLHANYVVDEPLMPALPGSLTQFLVERYCLYVKRGATMYRVRVRHGPYPLCAVRLQQIEETLLASSKVPRPADAASCHFSPGVDVDIYGREAVHR